MLGDLKSQESIMLNLTRGLLEDLFVHHQLPLVELNRDFQTIKSRTKSEGLSFLTKTLPALAKSLDSALLEGEFKTPTSFKRDGSSKLPRFLRGLFKLVFDQEGVLLDEPNTTAIKDLRQVGYLFYKYQLPYKERLVEHLFNDFVQTDKDIRPDIQTVEEMGIVYYAQEVLNEILNDFKISDLRPKNGPGSVANGLPQWGRFRPTKFYPKLDNSVDYCNMFYYNDRHLFDRFERYFDLEYCQCGTAKALAVPKDSRGPRLISSEPSEFMTYQQALKNVLVPFIETNPLTAGRVNFTRQDVNRNLALAASISGDFATLDLEKASDLVSVRLVELLFSETSIYHFLMNTRSEFTALPDGRTIPLNKFAPMGSALCFPIEALTFFSLIVGERRARGIPLKEAVKNVYVYGDDIIVPTRDVAHTIEALELCGLRVNVSKSCFTGRFRESCGMDAFAGVDITPIKIKKIWQEKPEASSLASWLAVCNNLFTNGYWKASDVVRRSLVNVVGLLPLRTQNSPVLGLTTWTQKHVFESSPKSWRWNPDLQCFMRRAPILISKSRQKLQDGWSRMLRRGWYVPSLEEIDPFFSEPFDSGAFSFRYQAVKRGSWVTEHDGVLADLPIRTLEETQWMYRDR